MFGIFKKRILNDKTSDLKVKDIKIKYNLSEKDWEEQKRRYKANYGNNNDNNLISYILAYGLIMVDTSNHNSSSDYGNSLDTSYSYGSSSYSSGSSDYSSSSSCDSGC
jgi:hypothetical protein